MNRFFKEILFVIIIKVIALIIFHLIFGLSNFTEMTIDLNIHDTYFVISKLDFLIPFVFLFLFFSYLIRIIFYKFQNSFANWIFISISFLLLLTIPHILNTIDSLAVEPGWTIYPPLSAKSVEHKPNIFTSIYYIFYALYIFTIISAGLTIYKTKKHSV